MGKQYRVQGSVGKGGFGTVYRASVVGDRGAPPVAIKLLHEGKLPDGALARFRDEARILRLAKDRAIVNVEPPMMLNGRWAVVMDYIDGCSAQKLVNQDALPLGPALEIVGEVARALDSLHRQPGPSGEPLQVLHRDIKPDNIQITRTGKVKILDFGTAKAAFENREARTAFEVAGTSGYVAEERFIGMDGPSGDVFSLGVVLQVLVTATAPIEPVNPYVYDDATRDVLLLAKRMQKRSPFDRPKTLDVALECGDLRAKIGGESLADWAGRVVPGFLLMEGDHLTDKVLRQDEDDTRPVEDAPPEPDVDVVVAPQPKADRGLLVAGIVVVGGLGIGLVGGGLVVAAVAVVWMSTL